MADRLTDTFRSQDIVKRLNAMSQEAPELTLSEAIKNIEEDLQDEQIALDTNGY